MTTTAVKRGQGRSELVVPLFLLALGALVLFDSAQMATGLTQVGPVGPKAVPTVVGLLLLVVAVFLAIDVLRGGRGEPEGGEDVDLSHRADWRAVLIIAGSFLANVALIERAGWPISGAILFFGCAYALGSRRFVRDPLIAIALSVGSWYLFFVGLGINLPVGLLKGIL